MIMKMIAILVIFSLSLSLSFSTFSLDISLATRTPKSETLIITRKVYKRLKEPRRLALADISLSGGGWLGNVEEV